MALPGYNAPNLMGGDDWQTRLGDLAIGVGFPYAGMMGMDTKDPQSRQAMIAASLMSLMSNVQPRGKGVRGVLGGIGPAIGATMQQGADSGVQMTQAMDYFDKRQRQNKTRQWMRDNAAKFGMSPEMVDAMDPSDIGKMYWQEQMKGRQRQADAAAWGAANGPEAWESGGSPAPASPRSSVPSMTPDMAPADGQRVPNMPPPPGAGASGGGQASLPTNLAPVVTAAATKHGVPVHILTGLLEQESGFDPAARGTSGEIGIAQFMPGTAREYGIDPSDPAQSIDAAARYLAKGKAQFGSWEGALAAYNRGFGGAQPYVGKFDSLPYVQGVMGRAGRYGATPAVATGEQPQAQAPTFNPDAPGAQPVNPVFRPGLDEVGAQLAGLAGGPAAQRAPQAQTAALPPNTPGASTIDVPPTPPTDGGRVAFPQGTQVAQAGGRFSDAMGGGGQPAQGAPDAEMPPAVTQQIQHYESTARMQAQSARALGSAGNIEQANALMQRAQANAAKAQDLRAQWAMKQQEAGQTRTEVTDIGDNRVLLDKRTGEVMKILGPRPQRNEGEGREFAQEEKIRNQYIKQTETFGQLRGYYQRIQAATEDASPASDIALVYSFMKMLDPTSVVREGEFATAEKAGGVPEKIWSVYNKALNGERLHPSVRADFVKQASRQFVRSYGEYENARKTYGDLAEQYGLNRNRVTPDLSYGVQKPQTDAPPPAAGTGATDVPRKVNPNTGQTIILRDGRWVDEKTGQPVQ